MGKQADAPSVNYTGMETLEQVGFGQGRQGGRQRGQKQTRAWDVLWLRQWVHRLFQQEVLLEKRFVRVLLKIWLALFRQFCSNAIAVL